MSSEGAIQGNAVIGQSGGPTVVINQSLAGVAERLKAAPEVGRILGARHGVQGIINEQFVELQDLTDDRLERVAQTPGASLGASRDKPDEEYCQKIFRALEKEGVRYFFYIGGNDSSDTCQIVNDLARRSGYDLRCFHVPKTIDNDLMENDHTPGFASAARFVACAFVGDNLDNAALPGIKINVVMGRHAGFLTGASVLARQHDEDGPHLIYPPEVAFEPSTFLEDVERVYRKHGRCLIAVSEGVHDPDGTPVAKRLAQGLEQDAHGNIQLSGTGALGDYLAAAIKDHIPEKVRVRADTFGYLQRSFADCVSEVDRREAREVGQKAADLALSGNRDGSVAIKRLGDDPYRAAYERVELADVAAKTRTLPAEHIAGHNDIASSYVDYLEPIVGELPPIELLDGG